MEWSRQITWDGMYNKYGADIIEKIRDILREHNINKYWIQPYGEVLPEIINVPCSTEEEVKLRCKELGKLSQIINRAIHIIMEQSGRFTEDQMVDNSISVFPNTIEYCHKYSEGYFMVCDDCIYMEG